MKLVFFFALPIFIFTLSCKTDPKVKEAYTLKENMKVYEKMADSMDLATHTVLLKLDSFTKTLDTTQDLRKLQIINSVNMIVYNLEDLDKWKKEKHLPDPNMSTDEQIKYLKDQRTRLFTMIDYLGSLNSSAMTLLTDHPEVFGKWEH